MQAETCRELISPFAPCMFWKCKKQASAQHWLSENCTTIIFFLVQIKFFFVFFPKLGWKCLSFSEVDYPTITPTYTHIQWLARRCERVKVVSIGTSLSSSSSHSTYCHFSFVQLSATPGIPSRRDCLKLCTVIPTCTIHCIKLQSNAKDTEYLKRYWKDSDAARKW